MLVIAIIVAGLVIALSWAAAQRSDVEDVPPANKKPSDDDIEQSNELELSRSMSIGHTHEIVRETDRAKLTEPLPRQNHIQYLDHFHIRLMLDQAENERAEKARSSKSILEHLFGTAKGSLEAVDKTPPLDLYRSRELSRDLSSERSRNDDLSIFAFDAIIQNPDRRDGNPNCLVRGEEIRIFDHELAFAHRLIVGWRPPGVAGGLNWLDRKGSHIFLADLKRSGVDFAPIRQRWNAISDIV